MGRIMIDRRGRSQLGVAIVEFAVIAPVFMVLLFGMIQYGLIISAKLSLQNTAELTARQMVVDPTTDHVAFASNALPSNLSPANLSAVNYDGGYSNGTLLDATQIELTYNVPLIFPFLVPGSSGGVMPVSSEAIMK